MKTWFVYSILTFFLWGLWGVFTKLAVASSKPRHMLVFQAAGVLAFVLAVQAANRFTLDWSARGFVFSFLGGLFAFVGFYTFFLALEPADAKASTVVTLSALYPAVTILVSLVFLGERLNLRQSLGIALALIASVLLAL